MIEILAHRGYWTKPEEKNSKEAFQRAIDGGFGIETDFRDRNQELYIAHDVNEAHPIIADEFFKIVGNSGLPIAINVKADGLQELLSVSLKKHGIQNYFAFDASVPDLLQYFKFSLKCYSRISEYESFSILDKSTQGFWVDQFLGDWLNEDNLKPLFLNQHNLCFVSPELHKREHKSFWQKIKTALDKYEVPPTKKIQICTDYPLELKRYFDGKN